MLVPLLGERVTWVRDVVPQVCMERHLDLRRRLRSGHRMQQVVVVVINDNRQMAQGPSRVQSLLATLVDCNSRRNEHRMAGQGHLARGLGPHHRILLFQRSMFGLVNVRHLCQVGGPDIELHPLAVVMAVSRVLFFKGSFLLLRIIGTGVTIGALSVMGIV